MSDCECRLLVWFMFPRLDWISHMTLPGRMGRNYSPNRLWTCKAVAGKTANGWNVLPSQRTLVKYRVVTSVREKMTYTDRRVMTASMCLHSRLFPREVWRRGCWPRTRSAEMGIQCLRELYKATDPSKPIIRLAVSVDWAVQTHFLDRRFRTIFEHWAFRSCQYWNSFQRNTIQIWVLNCHHNANINESFNKFIFNC